MPTTTRTPLFKPRTLSFLRALKRNNDRAWFAAHKEEYLRDVHQPMLDFVAWVASELPAFAPELEASPRTSLFRIHRDTRFSADKTPFKTQVGAIFPHRDLHRNVSACLYVEIGPAGSMIFGGIYKPERAELPAIRDHIARTHRRLRALLEAPAFKRTVGAMEGDALQRVPSRPSRRRVPQVPAVPARKGIPGRLRHLAGVPRGDPPPFPPHGAGGGVPERTAPGRGTRARSAGRARVAARAETREPTDWLSSWR
jgi:uncharacterized protein (TIGR02453 family)